ncbi:MAG: undecaprenyl/decaprenyl-phosphate alpha-N-acetylglucosaminyl 1-phosphate transferase [Oceanicoccus sp.]|uniref:glycosyltransferase family 4 protein n=1 Tax=Oceanicoccus sp. TaxID=2691044 RepID=UPI0026132617|nr:MraY family glycosyltransferase [Oceanicoccus sp.]MCP3908872.1 undecaprenyl/decaprenyl-phosphate alpha-N-acetylglucosaminyl 1-phosphate transferase [Oceanicoccus sp.]
MELIYSFTVALFLTIAIMPLLIRFSAQLRLVDDPGADRKIHDKVMPRSGGLAIILGVFIPLFLLLSMDGYIPYLLIGSGIIILFGLLDDRTELNYKWKLFGQSLAVVVVMMGGIVVHQIPFFGLEAMPVWMSWPLTFVFLLGVINGVNFSDGLDGLAAGTSLLALATIAILATIVDDQNVALISLTVIGGVLGFLRYNTFPARIFMGDAGSQFLGFITACLAIAVTQSESSALNTFLPVIILGLPILDILQVVPVRIKKGLPLPGPDKEHFHHQLVKLQFKHHEVVGIIYLLQILMMSGAYFLRFESDIALFSFYMLYLLVVLGSLYTAHRIGWVVRAPQPGDSARDRRNLLLRKVGWVHHYSAPIVQLVLILFFIVAPFLLTDMASQFSRAALVLAVILAVLGVIFRSIAAVLTRVSCYSVSVFLIYLISTNIQNPLYLNYIDTFLVILTAFLMLSIRMSRQEQFRLDTQDLLILLMVVIVPQLPLNVSEGFPVGEIALRLAVLMYACEFLLARESRAQLKFLSMGSILGLFVIGIVTYI